MDFLLETERLLIRPYRDSDLESLFAYRNDPKVAKYQGWDIPYPRERAINWIANSDVIVPTEPGSRFSAALELKSTGEMIGLAALAVAALQGKG
jgi:RimJ/RimL family protein N-acetyltransferase